MRPLLIRMSAFGPYAGELMIPMDQLGEQGLYLITGDTGAGKTTIFDAICFALYGDASGPNRESSMFRSKYADADTPTYVEMTFSHGGKEYFIRRNPEYMRPAKRGSGNKKESANAEIHMPDGTVITKVRDVNNAVGELLGINREQFAQIAMLAQGDFMKLLLADTRQRQEIFRDLFHTGYYQTLQFRLEEERKKIYGTCEDAKKSVEQYVSGIVCDETSELASEVAQAKDGQLTTEKLIELVERLLENDLATKDALNNEREKLDRELEQVNRRIGKAEELKHTKASLMTARSQLQEKESRIAVCKQAFDEAKQALTRKELMQKECSLIEAELPGYEHYERLLTGLQKFRSEQKEQQEQLDTKTVKAEKLQNELAQQKQELADLADAGAQKEKLTADKDKQDTQIAALEELENRLTKRAGEQKKLTRLQEQYVAQDADFQQTKDYYEKLDQAYRDGQAGILASGLEEGMPCPVCGSTTHPHPARLAEEVPTDQELEQAKTASEQAREQAQESSRRAGEQRRALETLEADLKKLAGKLVGVDDLDELGRTLTEAKEAAAAHSRELAARIQEEDKKLSRRQALEKAIPASEEALNACTALIGNLKESIAATASTIEADTRQAEVLQKQLRFENRAAAEDRLRQLMLQRDKLQASYDEAEKVYHTQVEAINTLKGQIKGFEQTLQHAEVIDYEAVCGQKEFLMQQKAIQDAAAQTTAARLTTNERIRMDIMKKSEELAAAEKRLQWVSALADTACGKLRGKEKIMLETYIQTTYFDRIIERANVRLMKMSGGQYELWRMEQAGTNKGQSGLELGAIDHYNGTKRSVKTLSGGESFMASLSLALGLSDEVQSSAGGIRIDTMFVDEGFGSLDADSLELAYEALAGLTEGNRLVGIISHVADLKEKIDRQLIVTKEKTGGSFVRIQV